MVSKQELRKKYKALRGNLSQDAIENLSLKIANKLLTLPIWHCNYYHTFLSIETLKEVNTQYLLSILSGKDKNIIVSKSDFKTRSLKNYLLTDGTKIVLNHYGIPEPVDGIEINHSKIDVVFVPLLAFDCKGNRIGYGKGFYDTFLALCKPDVVKVGLSFFPVEAKQFSTLKTDVPLDFCVTPNQIYTF